MTRLDRGTVCITTDCAPVNRELLVVVWGYTHMAMLLGQHIPYSIARLDGRPFLVARGMAGQVQCRRDQLEPCVPARQVSHSWRPTGRWGGLLL